MIYNKIDQSRAVKNGTKSLHTARKRRIKITPKT
jgi:hypothetical protein